MGKKKHKKLKLRRREGPAFHPKHMISGNIYI